MAWSKRLSVAGLWGSIALGVASGVIGVLVARGKAPGQAGWSWGHQ